MRIFGLDIRRVQKAAPGALSPIDSRGTGNWFSVIRESFSGAWQRNITVDRTDVLTYSTVWACLTLIASDIAKLRPKLIEVDDDGIWTETENPAYSPVLRKPNHYQTRVKFLEYWQLSKHGQGNAYVLKERDNRNVVIALYVLDPTRVQVLVAPNGDVYYRLNADALSGIDDPGVVVPASEIIHDLCVPLYHPLCGISPIAACGLAATQGLKIQQHSAKHFANGAQLQGILTAPASISNDVAKRIQDHWEANYSGEQNVGKVAVLGDGLKFEPMVMTAVNAQLIEQLKWTAEQVCAAFHVPGYMVGIGPPPPYTDIQSINLQYYTQALQNPIENLELLLDEGLGLSPDLGIELDIDALARMDTKTQMAIAKEGVSGGIFSPNEGRAQFDRKPVEGGEQPYMQNQWWPLQKLGARPVEPQGAPQLPPPPRSIDWDAIEQRAIDLQHES